MKKMLLRLMLVLIVALMLPLAAGAVETVESNFSFYIGAGETLLPDYPDLAYMIGAGLTKEDFDITYSTSKDIPMRNFDENGVCTISSTISRPCTLALYMTYTPKVPGVGKKTIFKGIIYVREPLTEIEVLDPEVILAVDETATARFRQPYETVQKFHIADFDANVIDASLIHETWNNRYWSVNITPKAVGETDIIVEAYNGLQATIHVTVAEPPSKLSFAQDVFTCYVGDTVDLGIDLGGGAMYKKPSIGLSRFGGYGSTTDCFPVTWKQFYAKEPGEYTITMTTYNGHKAQTQVNAYSRENCVRLRLPYETVNVGQGYLYIYAYDAADNKIFPRLSITKGEDLAHIDGDCLVVTGGEGIVEITATNPDGSTVSHQVEVAERPTQVFLNATELTLNIGDTFDFEVTFDKGKSDYSFDHHYDDYFPPFKLFPIRREGSRIVAQAPGTARVNVSAGHLSETCYITVLDSDAAVSMVLPPEPFGVGHTFQLAVVDRTGKTYPAVFSNDPTNSSPAATVTPDGLVTGVWASNAWIYATLEDGRVLQHFLEVEKVPTWMYHPDIVAYQHYTTTHLEVIESDVGDMYDTEVYVSIEDPTVATYDGMFFEFHKPGTTKVTLTAIKGGAQTSFILTVLPADSTLYVFDGENIYASGYYSMDIPMGFYTTLPPVVDYYGNLVPVTWEITYHVPGQGNPEDYGFLLDEDKLACSWPSAYCQLTGTADNGETIRISAYGYRMAKKIHFQMDRYDLNVGESKQTEVMIDEMGYELGPIQWKLSREGIVSFDPAAAATGRPTATGLRPGTVTLTATLLNGTTASCTIVVGGVSPVRIPGDANGDGEADIMDALLILQHSVGWSVAIDTDAADVNASGEADIMDALLILQYSVGWDVELK